MMPLQARQLQLRLKTDKAAGVAAADASYMADLMQQQLRLKQAEAANKQVGKLKQAQLK